MRPRPSYLSSFYVNESTVLIGSMNIIRSWTADSLELAMKVGEKPNVMQGGYWMMIEAYTLDLREGLAEEVWKALM